MKIQQTPILLGVSIVALSTTLFATQASAQFDKILKGGAIIVIIDKFGGDINKAVNKLTGDPSGNSGNKTKVVPILSVGQGAYAGAAQVSGPSASVSRVQAVAQIEGTAQFGASLRMKGLIPITNRNVSNAAGLSRVYGVGITGLIDAKL
jgi:hypothetical protein